MISSIKALLPPFIRKPLARLKQALWGSGGEGSVESALNNLSRLGFESSKCIDVGAYQGEWTVMFRSLFRESLVLMIEAQDVKQPELQKVASSHGGKVVYELALLGPEEGREVEFQNMSTGSSVFFENSPYPRESVKKIQRTLDAVAASHADFSSGVDFIKLDVQGYELEVLKGARRLLQTCEVVLMEASLIPVNAGCPLIYEVMVFMHEQGFRLLDICGSNRRRDGALWQTDLLFIRENSKFLPVPALTSANWGCPTPKA